MPATVAADLMLIAACNSSRSPRYTDAHVLCQAAAVSGRHGGVRDRAPLEREIRALGHEVRQMPAHYVRAYGKRGKNDAADAAAICEAVTRPAMRFVAVKTKEQQAALVMHRTRELLVRQRTQAVNALRGLLAEFGISEPQGRGGSTMSMLRSWRGIGPTPSAGVWPESPASGR